MGIVTGEKKKVLLIKLYLNIFLINIGNIGGYFNCLLNYFNYGWFLPFNNKEISGVVVNTSKNDGTW